jgi:hypothetical protein
MKFIWHSVPLGDGIMAQEPLEEIRAAFLFFSGCISAGK